MIPRSGILGRMKLSQLPLFLQGKLKKAVTQQTIEPVRPSADNTVMQTLPAYMAFLGGSGYSASTTEKYFADIRKLSLFLREKKVGEITQHDIQQWIAGLLAKDGDQLDPKTVNRKVSAIINYFGWPSGLGIIEKDPTATLVNARTQSPLPDYLYEEEIKRVFADLKRLTGIPKELTPKTLRHTHVVRA